MLHADPLFARPSLTNPALIAQAIDPLLRGAGSNSEVWRRLTETYSVDLDAVAALLPRDEPEPAWLPARD